MQISSLFRRGIVMPKTDDAEKMIESNDVDRSIEVENLSIQDDKHFQLIWNSGIFRKINAVCDTQINDYEEERVPTTSLPLIIDIIDNEYTNDAVISEFLEKLHQLCLDGMSTKMPLYFIL